MPGSELKPIALQAAAAHIEAMRILDVESVSPAEALVLTPHLAEAEEVLAAFVSPTGSILFARHRILLVQREHLLEEKVETASWPYREVRHFAIQEGAQGSGRSALKIWLGTEPQPLHLRAGAGCDLHPLQRLLAERLA